MNSKRGSERGKRARKKMGEKLRRYSEHLEELVDKQIKELRDRERDWKLLYDVTKAVTSSLDIKTVLNSITEKTAKAMGVKACLLRLRARDEKGEKLEIAAVYGLSDKYFKKGPLYLKTSPIDQVVQNGEVVTIFDLRNDPRVHYGEEAKREGIVSSASVPLMLKEESIGVIRVYTSELHKFDENELRLLAALGSQAAIAIENARLHQAGAHAERMVAIGETAAMVGHDLRNPLQTITNTLYLAKKELESMPSPAAEKKSIMEMYKTLGEQAYYMDKLVSSLQVYARPLRPEVVPTSLRSLIDDTLSTVTVPENVKVSVKVERGLKAIVDPVLMRRVLVNLITNAVEAMPDGGRLTIRASKKDEAVFIGVEDTGIGIPEKDIVKLFKPYPTTKPGGTGLGLVICKRLVEAHGGTITVKSKVGKGSTFTVKILLQKRG